MFTRTHRQLPGAIYIVADPTSSSIEVHAYGSMDDPMLVPSITHLVKCAYAVHQLRQPPPNITIVKAKATGTTAGPAPKPESYLVRETLRFVYQVRLSYGVQRTLV